MNSSAPDHDKYAAEHGHPVSYPPAAGYPDHNPRQTYNAPHSIFTIRTPSHGSTVPWSTSLCHCCDNPANCLITCCCPCITFGQIAEIVNKGSSTCAAHGTLYGLLLLTGFPCLYSCFYRSNLRGQLDLEEAPCVDCLVHFCCEPCALCQEYRELRIRGFDMGIGWEANMARLKRGVMVAPGVSQSMSR